MLQSLGGKTNARNLAGDEAKESMFEEVGMESDHLIVYCRSLKPPTTKIEKMTCEPPLLIYSQRINSDGTSDSNLVII